MQAVKWNCTPTTSDLTPTLHRLNSTGALVTFFQKRVIKYILRQQNLHFHRDRVFKSIGSSVLPRRVVLWKDTNT